MRSSPNCRRSWSSSLSWASKRPRSHPGGAGTRGLGEVIPVELSNANGPIRLQGWSEDYYQLTVASAKGRDRVLRSRLFGDWEDNATRKSSTGCAQLRRRSISLHLMVPEGRTYQVILASQNGSLRWKTSRGRRWSCRPSTVPRSPFSEGPKPGGENRQRFLRNGRGRRSIRHTLGNVVPPIGGGPGGGFDHHQRNGQCAGYQSPGPRITACAPPTVPSGESALPVDLGVSLI